MCLTLAVVLVDEQLDTFIVIFIVDSLNLWFYLSLISLQMVKVELPKEPQLTKEDEYDDDNVVTVTTGMTVTLKKKKEKKRW